MDVDFVVDCHGSIVLLLARSEAAQLWCAEHLQVEDYQRYGMNGYVVEPRYVDPIVEGFSADGYTYTVTGGI